MHIGLIIQLIMLWRITLNNKQYSINEAHLPLWVDAVKKIGDCL